MLPEFILREEESQNYFLLFLLGFLSVVLGFGAANILFPSESDLIAVFLAAIPLVYPLTKFFLDDEKEGMPHTPEITTYFSLFAGEVLAFTVLGYMTPELFELQVSIFEQQLLGMGITGYSISGTAFMDILLNNLVVFGFILGVALLIGSAGAFILTWNASVLGVFLGILAKEMPQGIEHVLSCGKSPLASDVVSPICYIPHATFEMTGFIVAGISGSLMSAAIYRGHLSPEVWENLIWMTLTGIGLVYIGAGIETGRIGISVISMAATGFFAYMTADTTQRLSSQE